MHYYSLKSGYLLPKTRSSKKATTRGGEEQSIQLGQPLLIKIETLYTGDAPKNFWGKKDLLLNSGIRKQSDTGIAPRAIHALLKKPKDKVYIEPSTFSIGNYVVYYTPSLEAYFDLSFVLMPEKLEEKVLNQLGNLFLQAKNIPIFAPAGTALMVGNVLTKALGSIAKLISSNKPFMEDTLKLSENMTSGYAVIYTNVSYPGSGDVFKSYEVKTEYNTLKKETRVFLSKKDVEYSGPFPYLILSLKSEEQKALTDFEPLITSATILEQFYNTDQSGQFSAEMTKVLSNMNDISYLKKIGKLNKKLGSMAEGEEKEKMKEQIGNLKDKIQDKELT